MKIIYLVHLTTWQNFFKLQNIYLPCKQHSIKKYIFEVNLCGVTKAMFTVMGQVKPPLLLIRTCP